MNICPVCRQPPRDAMLVKCERCQVPFVDDKVLFSTLSQEQLRHVAQQVLKSWTFWSVLLVGIVGIVWLTLGVIDYFTGRKVQTVIDNIQSSVSSSLNQAHTLMTNNIARRFREPELQSLMETVVSQEATARIDSTADRVIEQKLTALVRPQIDQINATLTTAKTQTLALDKDVDVLHQTLSTISDEQQFLSLANSARLYSLKSFLDLERLSQTTNSFAKDAGQIVWALRRDMEIDRQSLTEYVPVEQLGEEYEYTGPFTSEEIAYRFKVPSAVESAANVARKENLRCFVPQLVALAKREDNLWVQNRITHAISALSGQKFFPWTLQRLSNWWETSSSQFTNWPYATFEKGMDHFASLRYKEAVADFESIIVSDPYADKSRALAIASAIEVGDTNKAVALSSAWKYPDGRWARWTKAKMNLSTGEVAQATEQLATIAADFKTFSDIAYMQPGNHVLRKVNWDLYRRKLKDLETKK